MLSLTILNCISFGLYGQLKISLEEGSRQLRQNEHHRAAAVLEHGEFIIAGALTGASAAPISTPFEMVKVRLQLDNVTMQRYRGSWHCAKDIVRNEGLLTLYRGFVVNTVREGVFCAAYLCVLHKSIPVGRASVIVSSGLSHSHSLSLGASESSPGLS